MTAELSPGSNFAGYRVEALLGRGGMGIVYRAMDLNLDRPVALKLIAPEATHDARFRARFLKEPRSSFQAAIEERALRMHAWQEGALLVDNS